MQQLCSFLKVKSFTSKHPLEVTQDEDGSEKGIQGNDQAHTGGEDPSTESNHARTVLIDQWVANNDERSNHKPDCHPYTKLYPDGGLPNRSKKEVDQFSHVLSFRVSIFTQSALFVNKKAALK